ncbi:hypothetical protein [Burkholderia vietnamiensis]|uniref:hypothetical protein n=1 Tax=Burkholderia vietnamiensis TaxID=60552 RepID=UPI0018C6F5E8|nr:hypothetical protein [Burkholderia vietnamiensis]HDR9058134.1 hypothetical protein [Burkholderia vietnamiensis]
MLLPLSTEKVRSLSLEHHMAMAAVHSGSGDSDQWICLLRVFYLVFYMRNETGPGVHLESYRRADGVRSVCIALAESGEAWALNEDELADAERVLVVHDEQLAAIPRSLSGTAGPIC